ncbi:hypothetical protein EJB05_03917 [Eragrostis curvula]|uniref:Galactinol--sucrose galactosyltransferase n=1 Tax=Eragrostis curvula TaxID=38414 RepID=A0A5J9WAZ6_9POAL|nr:hypothetical protein EJB05_03917 [Eragrostis curvula]
MTVTPKITVADGRLVAHGRTVLTGVPDNIVLTHASGAGLVDGAFVGATADDAKSMHVFTFGTLSVVTGAHDFVHLVEVTRESPHLRNFQDAHRFRAALQGNDRDELEITLESGDKAVQTAQAANMVYVHAGTNPFDTITQAVKVVERHMQTFHHRDKKKFASRLTGIKENAKFQKKNQQAKDENQSEKENQSAPGLKLLVEEAKREHGVKYVYVWHAMAGYWGGVKPAAEGMEHYESALAYPVQSPGVMGNQPDIVMDSLSVLGLGLVHPRKALSFYDELHSYLASCGVDGVKVDVQNIIETLGAGHGGRVSLTRAYHHALEASVARNFPDNGCISCMCHNTDMLYSARQTAVVRASDDFYPRDPASHTIHISSVAYNTLFLGEFMQPDWDMFHSLHPAAEYHGAARAIGGCPIYVSDKPGNHNFELLKKLVLPDGSVLRAQLPGRPTRDCLFADPARDGASLLKIWNVNKCNGVVGVFNCQGAGWCRVTKKTRVHDAAPGTLTGTVRADDVDALAGLVAGGGPGNTWTGEAVVYAHRSGELVRLPRGATLPVTLKVLEFELFHVCPVTDVGGVAAFAPIGLLDMFNSGGAVEQCEARDGGAEAAAAVVLRIRGCGRFGAYCSRRPARCTLDAAEVEFTYDADTGLVVLHIPVPEQEFYRWTLEIQV